MQWGERKRKGKEKEGKEREEKGREGKRRGGKGKERPDKGLKIERVRRGGKAGRWVWGRKDLWTMGVRASKPIGSGRIKSQDFICGSDIDLLIASYIMCTLPSYTSKYRWINRYFVYSLSSLTHSLVTHHSLISRISKGFASVCRVSCVVCRVF